MKEEKPDLVELVRKARAGKERDIREAESALGSEHTLKCKRTPFVGWANCGCPLAKQIRSLDPKGIWK